ncbi:MAG: FtsH protease activity modulator HflK [Bilophila wadsworthia]
MNWDWDKLQEKRQRQNWGNSNNNSNNNNNNNKNDEEPPFGSGSGNGGGKGPDYEKFSDAFKRLPHLSAPAGGKVKWILVALVAVWLLSGIYIVNPDEEGVVLRFGKYDRTVGAGPHYALPFPIETVYKPKVTQVQRVEVGFRSVGQGRTFQQGANRSLPEESGMLTGDENIVNVQFSVQYQIKNPVEYLFNVTDQAAVVKNAAEAAMREVIGSSLIDSARTAKQIQTEATQLPGNPRPLQGRRARHSCPAGRPPPEVSDAFKDVASAREDKSRIINEAEAYRNELIPKARGLAAEVENQAQAYKETRIRNAEGEANRFLALLKEYEQAKDVTKQRMYLETMEEILRRPGMEKLVLPKDAADRVLPLLPLMQSARPPGRLRPKNNLPGPSFRKQP